jgi:hypothetical protein
MRLEIWSDFLISDYGDREIDVWEPRDYDEWDEIPLSRVIWNELAVTQDWTFCFKDGEPLPSRYVSEHREHIWIRHRSDIEAGRNARPFIPPGHWLDSDDFDEEKSFSEE